VDFDATGQLLIVYSAFFKYFTRNGNTTKQDINSLQIARKLMIQLGGKSTIILSLSFVSP